MPSSPRCRVARPVAFTPSALPFCVGLGRGRVPLGLQAVLEAMGGRLPAIRLSRAVDREANHGKPTHSLDVTEWHRQLEPRGTLLLKF